MDNNKKSILIDCDNICDACQVYDNCDEKCDGCVCSAYCKHSKIKNCLCIYCTGECICYECNIDTSCVNKCDNHDK
jgi:hypothetical protein